MSYHHLSTYERGRIEAFHRLGYSNREIAFLLERHRSCIDREIKRNTGATAYQAEVAGQNYNNRRMHSKPKGNITPGLVEIIEQRLRETWSPEQISNVATPGMACFKGIYNWIYAGKLRQANLQHLRHKGKRRKADKPGRFALGMPISQRPPDVKHRKTFGHWELDTMVSSRGESKGCFATFVERKSRLYTALKIADRSAESMKAAITQLYRTLPEGAFKTATTDRGKEFACYGKVKDELGLTLYSADAQWLVEGVLSQENRFGKGSSKGTHA